MLQYARSGRSFFVPENSGGIRSISAGIPYLLLFDRDFAGSNVLVQVS